jgi:hypothetical protein
MKTVEFEVAGVKYKVDKLSAKERREADRYKRIVFREAMREPGAWLQAQVSDIAKKTGVWSDETEARVEEIRKELLALETKLSKGGYELAEAKADAERMQQLRADYLEITMILGTLSSSSVEGQAESAEADYCMFLALKKDNGEKYCADFDDFLTKKEENDPVVLMATIQSSGNLDFWQKLPENKFLNTYFKAEIVEKQEDATPTEEFKPFLANGAPVPVEDN